MVNGGSGNGGIGNGGGGLVSDKGGSTGYTVNNNNNNNNNSSSGNSNSGTLVFLGLLSLTSRLKDDTCETISHLKTADIHVNMITGDHVHTAIAVARDCGIILSVDSPYNTHTPTGREKNIVIPFLTLQVSYSSL